MQTLIGAVLRSTFDTCETFPFDDGCPNRACRGGRFERRCKVPRIRAMAKSHYGFASHFATEGNRPVCRRENGILRPGLQIHPTMARQPLFGRRIVCADDSRLFQRPSHQRPAFHLRSITRRGGLRMRICRRNSQTASHECGARRHTYDHRGRTSTAIALLGIIGHSAAADSPTVFSAIHGDFLCLRCGRESKACHRREPVVQSKRPCGRRTALIHMLRACRARSCHRRLLVWHTM